MINFQPIRGNSSGQLESLVSWHCKWRHLQGVFFGNAPETTGVIPCHPSGSRGNQPWCKLFWEHFDGIFGWTLLRWLGWRHMLATLLCVEDFVNLAITTCDVQNHVHNGILVSRIYSINSSTTAPWKDLVSFDIGWIYPPPRVTVMDSTVKM